MQLYFVGDRIRTEVKFASVEELLSQVERDVEEVRRRLETPAPGPSHRME